MKRFNVVALAIIGLLFLSARVHASSSSLAGYYLLDQDADQYNTDVDGDGVVDLLANNSANGLRFKVDGGEELVIEFDESLLTNKVVINHEDFVAALQSPLLNLITQGKVPADTTLTVRPDMTKTTYLDDGSLSSAIPAIVLQTKSGSVLEAIGATWVDVEYCNVYLYPFSDLQPIVSAGEPMVAAGSYHTVGLKSDGTIVAVGHNFNAQCDVDDWTDVVQVAAAPPELSTMSSHTVGIKSDGTVVAVGWNYSGQCDVDTWTDIVQVVAGSNHTVGLKSDGTVVAVGDNYNGQCDIDAWTHIVQVAAGFYHTVGLKSDGTVVAVGRDGWGQCDIDDWTDIVQVAAGYSHTVGLKSDGTVVAVGNDIADLLDDDWTDIVQVAAGYSHTVGLKSDGTVVAVGWNYDGQCDVDAWTHIVQVAAGSYHTVGLKSDGTVVAVGNDYWGQCDVDDWNLGIKSNIQGNDTVTQNSIVLTKTSSSATITTGSDKKVYGTNGANSIILESGAKAELFSFPGNNTITIQADSNLFMVSRSGATVSFKGTDGTVLKMPVTETSQKIEFNDTSIDLVVENNKVLLGKQVVNSTPNSVNGTDDKYK